MEDHLSGEGSRKKNYREVALSLNVDASTVCRTNELFEHTGDVSPKSHPSTNPGTTRLTEIDKFLILEVSINKPGIYIYAKFSSIYMHKLGQR